MKRNKYQTFIEVDKGIFLYFNSFSSKYLLLDEKKHNIYQNSSLEYIKQNYLDLYKTLLDAQFVVSNDFDEQAIVEYKKIAEKMDTTMYHVVVNVTLDCNLRCWYCYETKIHNSKLYANVIEAIKLNVTLQYEKVRFKTLKISFFGGEPFLNFEGIRKILDFARTFCKTKDVVLLADFTTNATLIRKEHLEYLQDLKCFFQITLDGNRQKHNEVKHLNGEDTFMRTIDNIHNISNAVKESYIWVRINYDEKTLEHIDDILALIDDLDKNHAFLILRKIWQTDTNDINSKLLTGAIQKILNHKFFVDCYALSRSGICFAERMNQVLVNFDGKVFKCSTLKSFDDDNSLGKLNLQTGEIKWDLNKVAQIPRILPNKRCSECCLYPCCLGPCNKNILKSPDRTCIIDEMNLSMRDYLMYNFKLNLLYENFSDTNL